MNKAIFAAALLAFSLPAMALDPATAQKVEGCSTKAWKTATTASLRKAAKLTKDEAKKIALDSITLVDKKATEAKLQSEDGCLVYSIDVLAGGDKQEFMVDAGDGRILRQRNGTIVGTAGTKIKEALRPSN